ncbi:MAG: DUF1553 domain-containing protein, partial [Gemmataceae bacterium]
GTLIEARLFDRALTTDEVRLVATGIRGVTEAELVQHLSVDQRQKRDLLQKQLRRLDREAEELRNKTPQKLFTNVSLPKPPITRFLVRGQANEPADVVAPGGLSALPQASFGLTESAGEPERRAKLAQWMTHPKNPLFARVIVNRLWHHHFGIGIVDTPNDFGFNGGRPSHPELLDFLATEFIQQKYSLKALQRQIVMTAAYQQQSAPQAEALAKDAETRFVWRKRPQRLEAEAVRDSILHIAGLLDTTVGGPGFNDYRIIPNSGTTYYEPIDSAEKSFQRRSIYRFVPRGANPGLLETFDCPDPSTAAPRRATTTTPLQALTLWNGAFTLRTADAFANRLTR